MNLDELISKIMEKSGLKKGEIKSKIKEKQEELGGLITPEGAAHIVANELGINLFEGVSKILELKIENIIPGMSSVDVVGRVIQIFEPREFDREDGTKGKVCSLILADGTARIRVVFWGKDVDLVEEGKIQEEGIIKIMDGYTKENINGEAEIHIGNRARVVIDPKDVEADIPLPEEMQKKIAELEDGMSSVDVVGKVLRVYEPREFDREDGTKGKVANIYIGDETGKARVVLWDEDVGLVETGEIKEEDIIKVKKGYVRIKFDEPDINVGKYGKVILNPPNVEIGDVSSLYDVGTSSKKIEALDDGDRVEVRGALVEIFESLPVFEKEDGHGLVVSGVLDDGTANIRAVFFNKMAETLLNTTLQKVVESDDPLEVLLERKKELLGKELIAIGNVKHKEQFDRLELFVNDLNLNPDPIAEGKKLLNKIESGG
ncbi:MAG: DUF2240 family protein [Candidatus Hydrothermarchaeales archaeon]